MRLIRILLLLLLLSILSSNDLQGEVRERGMFRRAAAARTTGSAPSPFPATEGRQQSLRPSATWSMTPELYPQWYGGFHGRALQNYGYPSGDLGLRGQAW
jgi:hypothetical protein